MKFFATTLTTTLAVLSFQLSLAAPTPAGGELGRRGCSGVGAWSFSTGYTGGSQSTYGGHLWTAKWWTQGDTPGGPAGVWTDNGSC